MMFVWLIIGGVMLVVVMCVPGRSKVDSMLLLPTAFGLWMVVGVFLFIIWLVSGIGSDDSDCLDWNIETVSCDD